MGNTLHFTIGNNIDTMVRHAYWYDDQKEWAMRVLGCLRGITDEQKTAVLNSEAKLVPAEDGRSLILINEPDEVFKKELIKYKKWRSNNFQKILGRWVRKALITEYVEFVVHRYRLTLYHPGLFKEKPEVVFRLEEIRRALHDACVLDASFDVSERDKPVGERHPERTKFEIELGRFIDEEARRWTHIYKAIPALHARLPIDIDEIIERLDKKYGITFTPAPFCPKCDTRIINGECECLLEDSE